jgi:tRNA(Arg) A34 adenosine deaminase TadA
MTHLRRRMVLACGCGLLPLPGLGAPAPEQDWQEAAQEMKRLAESWGDQPYGAVVVLQGQLVGEGPSRVVRNNDPTAHAEREAIRDAQRRLGRKELRGAVLFSTSRPCVLCEAAAQDAGVTRMIYGPGWGP